MILKIQEKAKVDITGRDQHGFEKGKSSLTLGIKLKSLIIRTVDDYSFALMASLDLSAALYVVNILLLPKCLKIIGLPPDGIKLIRALLTN
jgi:hypothetical protein